MVRARAVPACASCCVQVGVGPGGEQQQGSRLGWGCALGQALWESAFYGGPGGLGSDSASRRPGALVCCVGPRASVEGDGGVDLAVSFPSGSRGRGSGRFVFIS